MTCFREQLKEVGGDAVTPEAVKLQCQTMREVIKHRARYDIRTPPRRMSDIPAYLTFIHSDGLLDACNNIIRACDHPDEEKKSFFPDLIHSSLSPSILANEESVFTNYVMTVAMAGAALEASPDTPAALRLAQNAITSTNKVEYGMMCTIANTIEPLAPSTDLYLQDFPFRDPSYRSTKYSPSRQARTNLYEQGTTTLSQLSNGTYKAGLTFRFTRDIQQSMASLASLAEFSRNGMQTAQDLNNISEAQPELTTEVVPFTNRIRQASTAERTL